MGISWAIPRWQSMHFFPSSSALACFFRENLVCSVASIDSKAWQERHSWESVTFILSYARLVITQRWLSNLSVVSITPVTSPNTSFAASNLASILGQGNGAHDSPHTRRVFVVIRLLPLIRHPLHWITWSTKLGGVDLLSNNRAKNSQGNAKNCCEQKSPADYCFTSFDCFFHSLSTNIPS